MTVDGQGGQIPVKRVFAESQLPHRTVDQRQLAAVFDIHSEIDWVALRHEIPVRPGLVDPETPALKVAYIHVRVFVGHDYPGGRDFRLRSRSVRVRFPDVSLQGIAVRHLPGAFLHFVLGAGQQLPHFYSIVHRDIGDRAVG